MALALKAENISKQYRLGNVGSGTFVNDLNRWWAKIQGKPDPLLKIGEINNRAAKGKSDYVWALKGIDFEVEQGDVLGIIGKNGAGKSTLLKILSKITAPTEGQVKIKGRIASLLEVGTGFHPELTGRENIFLNGGILGMTQKEVKRKFDEIVDFAGVERYIDTPVKRYSSGMYVRLAFAVAAHLENEILIVDEVLAVGDSEFQKKCLGKMGEVSKGEGRTVLFVSHNMGAIKQLCNKGVLVCQGEKTFFGDSRDCVQKYEAENQHIKSLRIPLGLRSDREGKQAITIERIELFHKNRRVDHAITGQPIRFRLHFKRRVLDPLRRCRIGIGISIEEQQVSVLSTEQVCDQEIVLFHDSVFEFEIPKLPLTQGKYQVTVFIATNGDIQDWIKDAYELVVEDGSFYANGRNQPFGCEKNRSVLLEHRAHVLREPKE